MKKADGTNLSTVFGAIPVKRGDRVETARLSEVITEPRLVPEDLYRLAQIFY